MERSVASPGAGAVQPTVAARLSPYAQGMKLASAALTATGTVGLASALLAGATAWLLLTSPASLCTGVDGGNLLPMLHSFARAIEETLAALLRYL